MKLTDARVKALTLKPGKRQMRFSDGSALYLQLTKSGKYWRMNYRFFGKQQTLALGTYPQVSLKEARTKLVHAKKLLENNINPMKEKKAVKLMHINQEQASTFKTISEEWLKKKAKLWVPTTLKHKKTELNNHIFPWLGDMKLNEIQPQHVLSICQRVENNGYHEQAHRIKMICSQIMRYGVATGRIR